MKNAMKAPRSGALLFLVLGLLSSCRTDKPPAIPICQMDGFGGGDCSDLTGELANCCSVKEGGDGNRYYCPPSCMKDFFATTQNGMANFSGWCYGGTPGEIAKGIEAAKAKIAGTDAKLPWNPSSPGSKDF